jgi:Chorismate synthase
VTRDGRQVELRGKGRHDPCVLPRAIPMVEAMVALTLVDHLMMQQAQCELFPNTESLDSRPNPMGMTASRPGGPNHRTDDMKVAGGDGDVMLVGVSSGDTVTSFVNEE